MSFLRAVVLGSMSTLLCLPSAWAQEGDGSAPTVRYEARTEIDFESVDVSGALIRASCCFCQVREPGPSPWNPLIRFREDFAEELGHSADGLR